MVKFLSSLSLALTCFSNLALASTHYKLKIVDLDQEPTPYILEVEMNEARNEVLSASFALADQSITFFKLNADQLRVANDSDSKEMNICNKGELRALNAQEYQSEWSDAPLTKENRYSLCFTLQYASDSLQGSIDVSNTDWEEMVIEGELKQ